MGEKRQVSFFRNGRNQAVRIPREFEMSTRKGTIEKQGDRLIIEPVRRRTKQNSVEELFEAWRREPPLSEDFPELPELPHDSPPDLG